jgi:bis(5'-nucleosidyl)-tetraphosphatase
MAVDIKKKLKEASAGVIICRKVKEGVRFLLLYHGGKYWNFPKGRLEKDEKDIQAALREVYEETGIEKKDLVFKNQFKVSDKYFFKRKSQRALKTITFFLALAKSDEVKLSKEHYGYGWFLYKEAVKLLKYKNLQRVIKRANRLIVN